MTEHSISQPSCCVTRLPFEARVLLQPSRAGLPRPPSRADRLSRPRLVPQRLAVQSQNTSTAAAPMYAPISCCNTAASSMHARSIYSMLALTLPEFRLSGHVRLLGLAVPYAAKVSAFILTTGACPRSLPRSPYSPVRPATCFPNPPIGRPLAVSEQNRTLSHDTNSLPSRYICTMKVFSACQSCLSGFSLARG
ncbi:hypothetical protein BDV95DRAFT_200629 [Massariosphaeria phaeospora]|uniref:Uncharacterized protein n=1 Tax=Massariosphaeria phaeospora TaxID=100035 RepID=A0A7C8I2R0_9PLEO|nr:hypothetical protein BDV95DRAFT_200629 [Massariosphaeria phaeospora]